MRLLATALTLAAVLLVGQTSAASAKQEKCRSTKDAIEFYRGKTWVWESRLSQPKTPASLVGQRLRHNGDCKYMQWVYKLWEKRAEERRKQFIDLNQPAFKLSTEQLYVEAARQIASGGIYSHAYGAVSPRLREVCYELVNRAFRPYGTQDWAMYIVRRESGCNPAAINYTYSDPGERATGLSQMIPNVHRWVDYSRAMKDMRYSIQVFLKLSDGGRSTGPWSTY